jgi:hypothetical protein
MKKVLVFAGGDGLRMTLAIYARSPFRPAKLLGLIELSNGVLTGSNFGARDIIRSYLKRAGGDAEAAYRMMNGYNNGYLCIVPAPPLARRRRARPAGQGRLW